MIRIYAALTVAILAFVSIPAAQANEDAAPSYSAKKQGRVVFQSGKTEETQPQASDTSAPEAVEPAAGAMDDASPSGELDESSLADDLKLPRKN